MQGLRFRIEDSVISEVRTPGVGVSSDRFRSFGFEG
jgi:hypothetical protein